jgi:hypothetical protein
LTLLDDTLQIVERTGLRWFAAELNRHKGRLLPPRASPGSAAIQGFAIQFLGGFGMPLPQACRAGQR